jgi:hypothetical protein
VQRSLTTRLQNLERRYKPNDAAFFVLWASDEAGARSALLVADGAPAMHISSRKPNVRSRRCLSECRGHNPTGHVGLRGSARSRRATWRDRL